MSSKGALVQRVVIKAGELVKEHFHKKMTEVYCIVEGNAKVVISTKEYEAGPGQVIIVKPGEIHSVETKGKEDFELVVFKTNSHKNDIFWV